MSSSSSFQSSSPGTSSLNTSTRATATIVLFYKYFAPSSDFPLLNQFAAYYEAKLQAFQMALCHELELTGCVLLSAAEGINGTLSSTTLTSIQDTTTSGSISCSCSSQARIRQYEQRMGEFDLIRDCGLPPEYMQEHDNISVVVSDMDERFPKQKHLFSGIDWKESMVAINGSANYCGKDGFEEEEAKEGSIGETDAMGENQRGEERAGTVQQPFPDLKIAIVKEIISTGGEIPVDDIVEYGGVHLSPEEFHNLLKSSSTNSSSKKDEKNNIVLVDVRSSFEYDIGHFIHPETQQAAINPDIVTFSTFDSTFCAQQAKELQDKKVLMYCTGGIRCEKATVMLKKRGVKDVYQLAGGIHRYLETYGTDGYFKGRNFVFDQRVAVKPSECCAVDKSNNNKNNCLEEGLHTTDSEEKKDENRNHTVVGKCIECQGPFDEFCGSRICTVCRDLVLVCPNCQECLREYHCKRHQGWKHCYFTFLDRFSVEQLQSQWQQLSELREGLLLEPCTDKDGNANNHTKKKGQQQQQQQQRKTLHKNSRRTLAKQMEKVAQRIRDLQEGRVNNPDPNAPRRCRSCTKAFPAECNGRCWGFWQTSSPAANATKTTSL